jgi:hypothetical protein
VIILILGIQLHRGFHCPSTMKCRLEILFLLILVLSSSLCKDETKVIYTALLSGSALRPDSNFSITLTLQQSKNPILFHYHIQELSNNSSSSSSNDTIDTIIAYSEVILNPEEQKKVQLEIKSDLPQENYLLSVKMSNSSTEGESTHHHILSVDRRNLWIFILTDKPTYRPGETVKVEVFLLDRYWRPVPQNVRKDAKISIRNSQGYNVKSWEYKAVSGDKLDTMEFALGKETALGRYTICVQFGGGTQEQELSFLVKSQIDKLQKFQGIQLELSRIDLTLSNAKTNATIIFRDEFHPWRKFQGFCNFQWELAVDTNKTCNTSSSMKSDNNNLIQEVIKANIVVAELDALPVIMSLLCPEEFHSKSSPTVALNLAINCEDTEYGKHFKMSRNLYLHKELKVQFNWFQESCDSLIIPGLSFTCSVLVTSSNRNYILTDSDPNALRIEDPFKIGKSLFTSIPSDGRIKFRFQVPHNISRESSFNLTLQYRALPEQTLILPSAITQENHIHLSLLNQNSTSIALRIEATKKFPIVSLAIFHRGDLVQTEYLTLTYSSDDGLQGMDEITRINLQNTVTTTAIRFLRVVAYTADLENDGRIISTTLPIQFTSNELDSKISLSLERPSDQLEEQLRVQGEVGVPVYFTTTSDQLNHPFTPTRLLQLEMALEMDDCIVLFGNHGNEKSHVKCWRNSGEISDNIRNLNESVDGNVDEKDTSLSFQETSNNATLSLPEIPFGRELSFSGFQFTPNHGLIVSQSPLKYQKPLRNFTLIAIHPPTWVVEETVPIRIIFQNLHNFTVSEEFLFWYHNGFGFVENQSSILQFQALAQNETTFYITSFRSETSSYTVLILNENLEHKFLFEKTITVQPRGMTETLKAITLVHLTEDQNDEHQPKLHRTLKISSGNSKPDKLDNIGFSIVKDVYLHYHKNIDQLTAFYPRGSLEKKIFGFISSYRYLDYGDSIFPEYYGLYRDYYRDVMLTKLEGDYQSILLHKRVSGEFLQFASDDDEEHIDRAKSIWRTSLVVRSFLEAKNFLGIGDEIINSTLIYLSNELNYTEFLSSVHFEKSEEITISLQNSMSVLITLETARKAGFDFIHNTNITEMINSGVEKVLSKVSAMKTNLKEEIGLLSLSKLTYLLITLNYPKAQFYAEMMQQSSSRTETDSDLFFKGETLSESVEVTSYALLIMLSNTSSTNSSKTQELLKITNWLIQKMNPENGLLSLNARIMIMKALALSSKFIRNTLNIPNDLRFTITYPTNFNDTLSSIKDKNNELLKAQMEHGIQNSKFHMTSGIDSYQTLAYHSWFGKENIIKVDLDVEGRGLALVELSWERNNSKSTGHNNDSHGIALNVTVRDLTVHEGLIFLLKNEIMFTICFTAGRIRSIF